MGDAAFYEAALPANRDGRLGDAQREEIEAGLKARHSGLTGMIGGALDPRMRDVRAGKVKAVDGAIEKRIVPRGPGVSLPGRHYQLVLSNREQGQRRHRCIGELWELVPEAGFVRLYLLPLSGWAVNFERLDGPAADASAEAFGAGAERLADALREHDRVGRAEAAAALEPILEAATGPAPGARPSAEPLARALLGTWRSALMRIALTLREDGTLTGELPDGSRHEGRWELDGSTLRADIPGSPVTAEAAVLGQQLILTVEGQSLAFDRVS